MISLKVVSVFQTCLNHSVNCSVNIWINLWMISVLIWTIQIEYHHLFPMHHSPAAVVAAAAAAAAVAAAENGMSSILNDFLNTGDTGDFTIALLSDNRMDKNLMIIGEIKMKMKM
jgi:hypothetical protein